MDMKSEGGVHLVQYPLSEEAAEEFGWPQIH